MSKIPTLRSGFQQIEQQAAQQQDGWRIVIQEDGAIRIGALLLTPHGIDQIGTVTESDMRLTGRLLHSAGDRLNIWIGDWLVRAELVWGQTYEEVAASFGYDIGSLRNLKSVMGKIDSSSRDDKLLFAHYKIAAAITDPENRTAWLRYAAANGLSANKMLAAINGLNDTPAPSAKINAAVKFFSGSKIKYSSFRKKYRSVGRAEAAQLSQMIDDQIAELQSLKRDIIAGAK